MSLSQLKRRKTTFGTVMEAIDRAQAMDRKSVRNVAATKFDTERIVDTIVEALAGLGSTTDAGPLGLHI